jgi:hypothetical protein
VRSGGTLASLDCCPATFHTPSARNASMSGGPSQLMRQAEFEQHVGPGNICPSIADALDRARKLRVEMEQEELHPVGSGGNWPGGSR